MDWVPLSMPSKRVLMGASRSIFVPQEAKKARSRRGGEDEGNAFQPFVDQNDLPPRWRPKLQKRRWQTKRVPPASTFHKLRDIIGRES